jgi:hypothetical protein
MEPDQGELIMNDRVVETGGRVLGPELSYCVCAGMCELSSIQGGSCNTLAGIGNVLLM